MSHVIATSYSLALAPSRTSPYTNFLFSLDNCVGIEFHTIRVFVTISAGACFDRLFSYAMRSLFCTALTSSRSLVLTYVSTASGIPPTK